MQTNQITFNVAPEVALAYSRATDDEKQKYSFWLEYSLRQAMNTESIYDVIHRMSEYASAQGLTDEILAELLKNEKKVILDTNILVSTLMREHSTPWLAFQKAFDHHDTLVSFELLTELTDVLNRKSLQKYIGSPIDVQLFITKYLSKAHWIEITERVTICRDERDNHLLELAAAGNADYLVTGDYDLLTLKSFRNTVICDANAFIREAVY